MLSRLFKLFRKESFDCVIRYGLTPKEFLIAGLELSPAGTVLEVSDIDFGLLPEIFVRIGNYRSLIFGKGGEAFGVDDVFIGRIREYDGVIPDVYCLVGEEAILLSVVNQSEILDFSRDFFARLDSRLVCVSSGKMDAKKP